MECERPDDKSDMRIKKTLKTVSYCWNRSLLDRLYMFRRIKAKINPIIDDESVFHLLLSQQYTFTTPIEDIAARKQEVSELFDILYNNNIIDSFLGGLRQGVVGYTHNIHVYLTLAEPKGMDCVKTYTRPTYGGELAVPFFATLCFAIQIKMDQSGD